MFCVFVFFFFQAEDGIRDLVRSRGLGDVYKRQEVTLVLFAPGKNNVIVFGDFSNWTQQCNYQMNKTCLLYTSDAADERSSVDLGGRRIIKKKK